MAISNKLRTMTWGDFKGAHPGVNQGRGSAALAGQFRRAKGMELSPRMSEAIRKNAVTRAMQNYASDTATLGDPGKPLPGVTDDMLGPPDAPDIGGRTSPGTTPRAKTNMPGPGGGMQMPNLGGPERLGRNFLPGGVNPQSDIGYGPGARLGPASSWSPLLKKMTQGVSRKPAKKPTQRNTRGNVQRQH